MSNGVGIVSALPGAVRIVGPRPTPPDTGGAGSSAGPAAQGGAARPSVRPSSAAPARGRIDAGFATPARPSRASAAAASTRPEGVPVLKSTTARPLVRSLSAAIGSAPLRDGTRLRLALSPAHLGDLRIELSMSGSRLRGTIVTESDAARDLILAHLDDLRRDLARRGLKVGRLDVVAARSADPGDGAPSEGPRPRSHRRQVLDLEA